MSRSLLDLFFCILDTVAPSGQSDIVVDVDTKPTQQPANNNGVTSSQEPASTSSPGHPPEGGTGGVQQHSLGVAVPQSQTPVEHSDKNVSQDEQTDAVAGESEDALSESLAHEYKSAHQSDDSSQRKRKRSKRHKAKNENKDRSDAHG